MNDHVDVSSVIAGMGELPPTPPPKKKKQNDGDDQHRHKAGLATTKSVFKMTYTEIRYVLSLCLYLSQLMHTTLLSHQK